MHSLPAALACGPFTRATAFREGISARILEGPRFVRIHTGVYRHRLHVMSWDDQVEAARLALPPGSATTGLTRIQQLGLDFGPRFPLHFVVPGDHHAKLEDVFLHRTLRQPPLDATGVVPAAALIECCRWLRTIDLIKLGDWLLHHGHVGPDEVRTLAAAEPWRAGSLQAGWLVPWLDGRARSLPESALRALIVFAGLPRPEVNAPIRLTDSLTILGDLWLPEWGVCLEYEGSQHQTDRHQYVADIDRHRLMRQASVHYGLITRERMRVPTQVVREVHALLTRAGYRGPGPLFGEMWRTLVAPLADRRPAARRTAPPLASAQ
jgi:hypothetical protein